MIADSVAGVVAVLAFGAGVVTGIAVRRHRSRPWLRGARDQAAPASLSSSSSPSPEEHLRARAAREAITAYGEQLGTLSFDPSAEDADEVAIGYFRRALDSYSRASGTSAVVDLASADGRESALAALAEGRDALAALDRHRKETAELSAAVDRFDRDLGELPDDADGSSYRQAAVTAAAEARELITSAAPGRREATSAALRRGRTALEALARHRAETGRLAADIAALRAELAALPADADATGTALLDAAWTALGHGVELLHSTREERGRKADEAVRAARAALRAAERRRTETFEISTLIAEYTAELESAVIAPDADEAEKSHHAGAHTALERATAAAESAAADRSRQVAEAVRRGRSALQALRSRQQETSQLDKIIRKFREQLDDLRFDPEAADLADPARAEYREAQDALAAATAAWQSGASAERRKKVMAALGRGRAALIRFEAVRVGRAVPLELVSRAELSGEGTDRYRSSTEDRHHYRGKGSTEFLLDRPEAGEPAILDVTVGGDAEFRLECVRRTARESGRDSAVHSWGGGYRGRELVTAEVTHLAVTSKGRNEWSVRVLPLSAARPLTTTARGHGHEVLRLEPAGHAKLTVQLLHNHYSAIRFIDEPNLRRGLESLDSLSWRGDLLVNTTDSEYRREEWVYGPGLLLVQADADWALDHRPATPPLNNVAIGPVDQELRLRLLELLAEDTEETRARAVAELRRETGAGPAIARAYVADLTKHR